MSECPNVLAEADRIETRATRLRFFLSSLRDTGDQSAEELRLIAKATASRARKIISEHYELEDLRNMMNHIILREPSLQSGEALVEAIVNKDGICDTKNGKISVRNTYANNDVLKMLASCLRALGVPCKERQNTAIINCSVSAADLDAVVAPLFKGNRVANL